MSKPQWWCSD